MAAGELHELSVAIGSLQAEVRILSQTAHEEREEAQDHRRCLREAISELTQSVHLLGKKVEEIEPVVVDYRNRREQDKGAARYRNWLWASAYATIGAVGATLIEVAKWLGLRPPHP